MPKYKYTYENLKDYLTCPIYYSLKRNIQVREKPSLKKMMGRAAKYFLTSLFNGTVLSEHSLKKHWDKLCSGNIDIMDPKKCIQGMDYLIKMYRWAEKNQIRVVDINTGYTLVFQENDTVIEISGKMEAVLFLPNKRFELLIIDFGNSMPEQASLDMSIEITMAWFGFEKLYSDYKLSGVRIYHVKHDREYFTTRNKYDLARLKKILLNFHKNIMNDTWLPRESPLCIKTCEAIDMCRYYGVELIHDNA